MHILKRTIFLLGLMVMLAGCAAGRDRTRTWVDLEDITGNIVKDEAATTVLETQEGQGETNGQPGRPADFSTEGEGINPYLDVMRKIPHYSPPLQVDDAGLLLNFDNVDIYEFIQAVGGALNLDYIIDPQVKGVVNIRSQKSIPQTELFDVFKKILGMNGLDIRSEGTHYYIFTVDRLSTPLIFEATQVPRLKDSPQMVIQVMPVIHLTAADAEKLLLPYLSAQGSIQILPNQNTIILADYESKVIDALNVLARLDISPLRSLNTRLVRINKAPLFDLHNDLMQLLSAMHIVPGDFNGISVVPLERLNSLLLISNSEYMLYNAEKWITQLDVETSEGRDNVYIYNVRNSQASELAALVSDLISEEGSATSRKTTRTPATKDKSYSRSTTTTKAARKDDKAKPTAPEPGRDALKTTPASGLKFASEPLLLADDIRNIILIRAMKEDHTRLVKLLERLDNMVSQVLIEVLIAEVTLTDQWRFGVEWALANSTEGVKIFQDAFAPATTTDTTAPPATNFRGANPLNYPHSFFANSSGIFSTFDTANKYFAILDMFASDSNLSILSSPHVMVLNNETATVNIGDQVPIVTSATVSADVNERSVQTIQYRDTGILLSVTPRINSNGTIILEIEQQVSNAAATDTSGINSPTISNREVRTKLTVKDGQSILMGGLISNRKNNTESGIPLLKDIPVLGWAFKSQSETVDKTELLIMITPHVIGSENVLEQYVREFNDKTRRLRAELTGLPPNGEPGDPGEAAEPAIPAAPETIYNQ